MKKSKALIVTTSHSELGLTRKKTGFFLSHVTHPLFELERAGWAVDIASTAGGPAPLDENSRDLSDPINRDYLERKTFQRRISMTLSVGELNPDDYAAIVLAGGYGALWDFRENVKLQNLIANIYKDGGIVGAIGEGASALLDVKRGAGEFFLEGKKITGPRLAEVMATGLMGVLPLALETELKNRGAVYSYQDVWQKHTAVDSRLVTSQNSLGAQAVGEFVVRQLQILRSSAAAGVLV